MHGYGHPFAAVQQSTGYPPVLPGGGIRMFSPTAVMGVPPTAMGMPPVAAVFPMQQPMYQLPMMQVCKYFLSKKNFSISSQQA